jgi:hypothetical protein
VRAPSRRLSKEDALDVSPNGHAAAAHGESVTTPAGSISTATRSPARG